MEILDFSKGQVWGMIPEKFESAARIFFDLEPKIDQEQFQAYVKNSRRGDEKPYHVTDGGSAVIPISGPLSKRMTFITWLMGGTTYSNIASLFKMALNDDDVNSIILDIDSPGGVVSGTEGVGDLIFNSRNQKPVVAFTSGFMASAAYWIGSAAEAIVAQKTASVGSIGVLMIHRDYSKMDQERGIKTTYITSGKYKALGNPDQPLSKDAKEYFQEEVNYVYSIFVDTVARNREVGSDKVITDMGDGRVFIGEKAKDAGLVDIIGDFDSALSMAGSMINNSNLFTKESVMTEKNVIETIDQLRTAFPDLVEKIQNQAVEAAKGQIMSDATKAERERILSLIGIQFDEEESGKLKGVIDSGITADQFKSIKDLTGSKEVPKIDPEKEAKEKILKGLEDSGTEAVGAGDSNPGKKDYMALVEEYMVIHQTSRLNAMLAINKSNPEARVKFIEKNNPQLKKTG